MKKVSFVTVWLVVLLFGFSCFSLTANVWAQYPERPVNFIVGFSPGGIVDTSSRALAEASSPILGKPIVVLNKLGGGSAVSLISLKSEKPDGYNVATLSRGGILNPLMKKLAYDVVEDFTPIITFCDSYGGVIVRADAPWKTFKELVDYAKNNPGKIRFGSAGIGLTHHLAMERLALAEGIHWTHIPFKGAVPAISAILGGHVEVAAVSPDFVPYVKSGRVRLLSVYTPERIAIYPDVPTWKDLGYDISLRVVTSIVAHKATPRPIIDRLHNAFKKGMEDPTFKKAVTNYGALVYYLGPDETAKDIVDFRNQWEPVIKKTGLAVK